MCKPLVTVVTLSYKKFEYIYSTIDSVLSQKYPRIEYIISDDGSDNFPEKGIVDYINKNKRGNIVKFSVITSSTNVGTVKNINRAYRLASGEILLPLSADDELYTDDVLDRIVQVFIESGCQVLVTGRMLCGSNGLEIRKIPSTKEEGYISKLNTPYKQNLAFVTDEFYDMASGSVMYIRRDFLENWGYFDESYFLWEDGPFLTQFTRNYLIKTDYSILSIKYRLGGISNGNPHPMMHRDRLHYNETDRVLQISDLPAFQKRKIQYICKRYKITSKMKIFGLYIGYLDVMVTKLLYKLRKEVI